MDKYVIQSMRVAMDVLLPVHLVPATYQRPDGDLSMDKYVIQGMRSLRPGPGDVFVVYVDPDAPTEYLGLVSAEVRRSLAEQGFADVAVLVLPKDVELSMVGEADMAAAGWVRPGRRGYEFL